MARRKYLQGLRCGRLPDRPKAQTPEYIPAINTEEPEVPEQSYIVTDRGGDRSYPILVTVNGPNDGYLYLRAQEEAARLSPEIADCGKQVSAFPVSKARAQHWREIEGRLNEALKHPENISAIRIVQDERRRFLKNL
jgi:hypothetical protein